MDSSRAVVARWVLLSLLAAALAGYFLFGGRDVLSLAQLKEVRTLLLAGVSREPALAAVAYVVAYTLLLGCAVPAGGVLNVTGGALFGWWKGALLASVGSTAGATLCMLGARLMARQWVQRRWPEATTKVDRGVEESGGTFLVSLRLAPGVPFVVLNVLMGLTAMRTWRFSLLTFASGIPGILVYSYAGEQVMTLDSVNGIMSPAMIAAFLALALLPLAGKVIAKRVQGRGGSEQLRRVRRRARLTQGRAGANIRASEGASDER